MGTVLLLAALHLPLIEKPAAGAQPYLVVLLTGDGGWRAIDIELAQEINRHGIPVVGLLSDDYFETARTPDEVARDVAGVIDAYAEKWRKPRVILIGYSRGADALPIALARMPAATRARVALTALLGASTAAELQIVPWWKGGSARVPSIALAPVVRSLRGMKLVCVHGSDETDSLCDVLGRGEAVDIRMEGGHHFGGAYAKIARAILAAVP